MSPTLQDTIPNLWPGDIRVDALSPVAILRTQAANLQQMTNGLLEGKVETLTTGDGVAQITFDIVAPALDSYRHRVLVVTHDPRLVYPVRIIADCLEHSQGPNRWPSASTQQEFLDVVRKAFKAPETRSVIESLVARSNDESDSNSSPKTST